MDKKQIAPWTEVFKIDVNRCARCGKNHKAVRFTKFINPGGPFTHWAHCPFTDDPILMTVTVPPRVGVVKASAIDPYPDGLRVYGREGTKTAKQYGIVVGRKPCNLAGCRGMRLCVHWSRNRRTWPCTKGLKNHRYGVQIV